ncbi:MAG: ParB/RepB/Spo0J family partition protein [Alphaproteobacteria bacterium]|nr:ParB/RepB/Spo0J family partition protein [Alphaproteobacteria bacterium]
MIKKLKGSNPRGLGRGLNALFEDEEVAHAAAPTAETAASPAANAAANESSAEAKSRRMLAVEMLQPGTMQPRVEFKEEELESLSLSLKTHGMLQPILVRPHPVQKGRFEIIAGERRWRAAQRAQLHEVPVIIRNLSDVEALEIALIENLQRADLNPVEEAQGYKNLMESHGYTQEKLAERLGKSRSHIANMVRLLTLPPLPLEALKMGDLTPGHARVLVAAKHPERLAIEILENGLNVRQAEALARGEKVKSTKGIKSKLPLGKDTNILSLEREIEGYLGLDVNIQNKPDNSGALIITYKNLEQLDKLLKFLMKV